MSVDDGVVWACGRVAVWRLLGGLLVGDYKFEIMPL